MKNEPKNNTIPMSKESLAYWSERWLSYGPSASTYPPEIWEDRYIEVESGIWPFIKKRTIKHGGICKLCKEELLTWHQCRQIKEVFKYMSGLKEDSK